MCSLILRDEAGHIAFHRDRLAAAGVSNCGVGGRMWEAQFKLFGIAAAAMLWLTTVKCCVHSELAGWSSGSKSTVSFPVSS
jgi:hypothetical protein